MVRSRTQWVREGERPTKYFCSLENKQYIEKTVKSLKIDDKNIIEQKEILKHMRNFYVNLYSNKYNNLTDPNLNELFKDIEVKKLTKTLVDSLKGPITELESHEIRQDTRNRWFAI